MHLEKLGLSIRVSRLLEREGILTVEELIEKKGELFSIRNFGPKAMKEIEEKLEPAVLKEERSAAPPKTLADQLEEILADREALKNALKESQDKLKALEQLEKFAIIQEKGQSLQKLVPWLERVTITELGVFRVELGPSYLSNKVDLQVAFYPTKSFQQSQAYRIGNEDLFLSNLSAVMEAIHEAMRRQIEAQSILEEVGPLRETILSLSKLLTIEKASDETVGYCGEG